MNEPPKDPTNQELLERIAALEAENVRLEARLDSRFDGIYKILGKLVDDFRITDEQVLELMMKVFPGHAETQSQIIELFKSKDKARLILRMVSFGGYGEPTRRPFEWRHGTSAELRTTGHSGKESRTAATARSARAAASPRAAVFQSGR